jgi:hypothetical protein
MSKRPRPHIPLWQWGLLVIIAGLVANMFMGLMPAPSGGSAAARGQAFGRGVATVLAIIAGLVLIIMHFVRRKPGMPQRKNAAGAARPKRPRRPGEQRRK